MLSLPCSRRVESPRWATVLSATLVVLFAVSTLAFVLTGAQIATDAAFYQHVGWALTRGEIPYVDVWDVNPPLVFVLTALLAVVAGGNVLALHALGVVATFAAVAVGVLGTGWLAVEVTGVDAAAVAAGLVMLLPAEVYGLPPWGVRSQYFALAWGVAGLAFALRDRPFASGVAVALAAGFWQSGAGLAPLVVGLAAQRSGRSGAFRAIGGGALVASLVVVPFAAVGALGPMVVETVAAPLSVHAPSTLTGPLYATALALGYGTLVVPVASYGWVRAVSDPRGRWWIPAGVVVYTAQLLFVDMQGSLDALLWLVFVALGVAVAIAPLASRRRAEVVGLVAVLVLAGLVWHLVPAAPLERPLQTRYERVRPNRAPALADDVSDMPSTQTIYWQKRRPDTCHYRLSWMELRWIARTNAKLSDTTCGRWPG